MDSHFFLPIYEHSISINSMNKERGIFASRREEGGTARVSPFFCNFISVEISNAIICISPGRWCNCLPRNIFRCVQLIFTVRERVQTTGIIISVAGLSARWCFRVMRVETRKIAGARCVCLARVHGADCLSMWHNVVFRWIMLEG